jgi:hypothetical protein
MQLNQDIFQQKMDECLDGLLGCCVIEDGNLNYGPFQEEHDMKLKTLLDIC